MTTLFKDVRVFDGNAVHERASVLIDGDRIVEVALDLASRERMAATQNDISTLIDGSGQTLMPGTLRDLFPE